MSDYHVSVFLKEAVDALNVQSGEKYIDATFGGGGHSFEIAKRGGEVLGIDVDEDAIRNYEKENTKHEGAVTKRIRVAQGNFANITSIAEENNFKDVDGILFDLGVSSHQFDTADRGFSFQKDNALDMRMDMELSVKASDLVNGLTKKELVMLFERYGEEHFARKIAEAIVGARSKKPIESTIDLAQVIERAVGRREKIHPATRVFQALRIAVNDELHSLENGLRQSVLLLGSDGRLVVITFHSLEDRIVKRAFLDYAQQGLGTVQTAKPLVPGDQEVQRNQRARSAKLRIFKKNNI